MKSGLINLFDAISGKITIVEWLDSSTFDELIELDVANDRYRILCHVDDKYADAPLEASFTDLYRFVIDNLVHPDDAEEFKRFMHPATLLERLANAAPEGVLANQMRFKTESGDWRWVELCLVGGACHGLPPGIVRYYMFDVQTKHDRIATSNASATETQSNRDSRTGLLRDHAFFERAERLLSEVNAPKWIVIAIDIDHFSLFNDWYGRATGDLLLERLGQELAKAEKGSGGLAGYLGQDDFCLIAPYDMERTSYLYDKLSNLIGELADTIGFKPAFGISVADGHTSVLDLFDQAKRALDYARADYRTDICLYDPSMREKDSNEYRVLLDFQRGLQENEFIFYLQPQCRISSKHIVGAEALARWRKPDGTIVPPDEFVPILEKHGFITDLDCYIWDLVCAQMREWLDGGHAAVPVSVNVSQNDFYTIDVAEHFAQLVESYSIPPSMLKVEITESAFADGATSVSETIARLRDMGFTVMMDDFGSGYSSLNRLSNLNVDAIKLDAAFMRMDGDSRRKGIRIVESIIGMAKTMGMPIICEGVETAEQIEFLESLGCRYIQGFYFYKPMSVPDFKALIGDGSIIDDQGFVVKTNEQLQIRAFLDENVYSDAMLNSILGPVAYYVWKDDNIDIVRFNEQFYEAVNVPDFENRLRGVQTFVPEPEVPKLFDLFRRASLDNLNGASDVIGFFSRGGELARFMMRVYYLGESAEGKRFYGSVRDVTDLAELQVQMKLLSYRLPMTIAFMRQLGSTWRANVVVHGLAEEMGLDQKQLQRELDDRSFLARMDQGEYRIFEEGAREAIAAKADFFSSIDIKDDSGAAKRYRLEADLVEDDIGDASYILKLTVLDG